MLNEHLNDEQKQIVTEYLDDQITGESAVTRLNATGLTRAEGFAVLHEAVLNQEEKI